MIAASLAENPRLQLSLHSGNTEEIVRLLLQDKISIGLIEGPSLEQGIRIEPFMPDELVLIRPPDFESERSSRDQLVASNRLMREQGSGSCRVVEGALGKAGVALKLFRNVMDLDSTEAIKSAVEAGLGIGFASSWAISKELELRALKVVQVDGKSHAIFLWLCVPGRNPRIRWPPFALLHESVPGLFPAVRQKLSCSAVRADKGI